MAWFKVDDKLHSSRKLMKIPRRHRLAAIGLWTVAGSWSADQLTDGLIPNYMIEEWGGTGAVVDALVAVGLWARVPVEFSDSKVEFENSTVEFQFWNWEEYQPLKADIEAGREKNAEKLRKWRERNRVTEPVTPQLHDGYEPDGNPAPDPTRPDPTPLTTSKDVVAPRKRGTRIPEPFLVTSEMRQWATERTPGVDVNSATEKFVNHWRATTRNATKLDWLATWRNWLISDFDRSPARSGKPTPEQRARQTMSLAMDIDMKEIGQ